MPLTFSQSYDPTLTQPVSISEMQQQVFRYLSRQANQEIALPNYPPYNISSWSWQRYKASGKEIKPLYIWVCQNLLVSQTLLSKSELQSRRQGLLLARDTNTSVSVQIKDKWLYARIFEAFLLPNLAIADDEAWQNLSRQRIIEGACSAYQGAGETQKQIVMLRLLIKVADMEDINTIDWAHGQLAQALASQSKYAEAIKELQAISSEEMSEMKKLIPQYEKLMAEVQGRKDDKNMKNKTNNGETEVKEKH